jgi:hypothetical protein
MVNVTFGWVTTTSTESENHVPTLWIGKRTKKLGSKNPIDLIFLEGYEKLGEEYVGAIRETGYNLIDAGKIYNEMKKVYTKLNRFPEGEKKCFLRWLVIKELYGSSRMIHYDGDIVFNETPENLEKKLGNYTFVLQGCPAFVSIRDSSWIELYEKNLNQFCSNIEGYSARAWAQREGYELSWKNKWAGTRYRKIISSDQDLVSHLIHTDILPQDSPDAIKRSSSDLLLFENPLYIFSHNPDIGSASYHRKSLVDYFGNRKVAFWHLQNSFADYLKLAYFLKYKLIYPFRVPNKLEWQGSKLDNKFINYFICNLDRPITKRLSRKFVCEYFFDVMDFSKIFTKGCFWRWM